MQLITEAQTRAVLNARDAADIIAATYRNIAAGAVTASRPSAMTITRLPHRLGAKGAVLERDGIAGVRLTSRTAPRQMLWSLETGEPLALIDESHLYRLRTGVSAVVVAQALFANESISRLAIIGTGPIAFEMVKAFDTLLKVDEIVVSARSRASTQAFCDRMAQFGRTVEQASDIGSAVHGASLVVTITTASEELLLPEDVAEGTVVISMGGGLEVSHAIWARAAGRFVDDLSYALHQGDAAAWIERRETTAMAFEAGLTGRVGQLVAGTYAEDVKRGAMAIVQGTTALDIALGYHVFGTLNGLKGMH